MINEIWKEIENSLYYEVSNLGRVKRSQRLIVHNINKQEYLRKERLLKPDNINSKQYWRIGIKYKDGRRIKESVHRLVAKAFIPNPNNLPQVNHIDGNKNNNNVENLQWCTNLENMRHAIKTGLRDNFLKSLNGEGSHLNKYSEETIKRIPEVISESYTYTEAAKKLGIPISLIGEIRAKRAWKYLNLQIPELKKLKK